jgi:hypothetical protein
MNIETNKYHVTYWYLATGQEGIPYTHDYGIIESDTPENAKLKAVESNIPRLRKDYPTYTEELIISIATDGLSAKLVE